PEYTLIHLDLAIRLQYLNCLSLSTHTQYVC
ncbi:MAG: hypothetical protein RLZZ148_1697, partial [Cyanobacteriota bacterium]